MKTKNAFYILIIIVSVIAIFWTLNKRISQDEENFNPAYLESITKSKQVLQLRKDELLGSNIEFIQNEININKGESRLLFVYNINDCSSCIKDGFRIVNYVDSLYGRSEVLVIGINSFTEKDEQYYNYKYHIHWNDGKSFRSNLDNFFTPSLIHINEEFVITDLLIVMSGVTEHKEIDIFLEKYLGEWDIL